jgi:hypothetical protein
MYTGFLGWYKCQHIYRNRYCVLVHVTFSVLSWSWARWCWEHCSCLCLRKEYQTCICLCLLLSQIHFLISCYVIAGNAEGRAQPPFCKLTSKHEVRILWIALERAMKMQKARFTQWRFLGWVYILSVMLLFVVFRCLLLATCRSPCFCEWIWTNNTSRKNSTGIDSSGI